MTSHQPHPTVLKMHAGLRHYIARQEHSDPIRALPDRHVRGMALEAFAQVPVPRDTEVMRKPRPDEPPVLRMVEQQVLEQLATDLSAREIAEQLFLTGRQVERSSRALYRAFGVAGRMGAVLEAIRLGFLELDGGVWRAVRSLEGLQRTDWGPGAFGGSAGLQERSGAVS